MDEPANEAATEPCEQALSEVEACCARADWTAAEGAVDALKDVYAPLTQELLDSLDARFAIADRLSAAAVLALAGARVDIAWCLLDTGEWWFLDEVTMVEALAHGDLELCAAYVIARGAPTSEARYDLLSKVAKLCALLLIDRGSRDERLIATDVVRAAFADFTLAKVAEDAEAWADAAGVRRDPVSVAEALVRLSLRRRAGEHAEVFEAYAAGLGAAVRETPELFEEAAACARAILERGHGGRSEVTTYVLHALLNGREDEARTRVDARKAASAPRSRLRFDEAWARAQELAREMRGEGERERPGGALVSTETGWRHVVLGDFLVVSGTLLATDPCVEGIDSRAQVILRGVRRGTWSASVFRCENSEDLVASVLVASHVDRPCSLIDAIWWEAPGLFGVSVDSGQAGIFDVQHYRDETLATPDEEEASAWYAMCCAATSGGGGVIPHGCVTSSGFGDGFYSCSLARSKGQIVGVAVVFGPRTGDEEPS